MNKLNIDKRRAVVSAIFEGASINSTVRITGVAKTTILRLVQRLGNACVDYHDEHVRALKPEQVQTDEIWAFIGAKAKNVSDDRSLEGWGDTWTWTAITDKKLIIAYRVGSRTQADADEFMLDLAGRITSRVQLSSDGHKTYLNAVENAFGSDVDYTQLVKSYGKSGELEPSAEAKYSPPRINGAKKVPILGLPDREHISTSYVERHNLTIRMGMRRFTRLTNAHSKKVAYHVASVAMFFMFYNYCRVHATLRTTPAVTSGLADYAWTQEELLRIAD